MVHIHAGSGAPAAGNQLAPALPMQGVGGEQQQEEQHAAAAAAAQGPAVQVDSQESQGSFLADLDAHAEEPVVLGGGAGAVQPHAGGRPAHACKPCARKKYFCSHGRNQPAYLEKYPGMKGWHVRCDGCKKAGDDVVCEVPLLDGRRIYTDNGFHDHVFLPGTQVVELIRYYDPEQKFLREEEPGANVDVN